MRNFIKNTMFRKSEQLRTLVTFSGGAVSSNQCPRMVWLTAASQCFQITRVRDADVYSCDTMEQESSIHSACSMFLSMLLEQRWNFQYIARTTDSWVHLVGNTGSCTLTFSNGRVGGFIICLVPPLFFALGFVFEKFQKWKWRLSRFVWRAFYVRW